MDRASASEAGNVGSTPAERKFENPALCGVFNLHRSRQTALPASGVEGRSDVFVCAHKKPRGARGQAGCKNVLNGAITREKSGQISC